MQFSLSNVSEYLNCWQMILFLILIDKQKFPDLILKFPPPVNRKRTRSHQNWCGRKCPSSLCQRQQEPTCINSTCIHWAVPTFSEKHCSYKILEKNILSDFVFRCIFLMWHFNRTTMKAFFLQYFLSRKWYILEMRVFAPLMGKELCWPHALIALIFFSENSNCLNCRSKRKIW